MACESRGACTALGGQVKDHILVIANPLGAEPGQSVRLHLPESSVVNAAFVLYGLPALALIAGAGTGNALAGSLGLGSDPATALGAGLGLVLGLVLVWLLNRKLGDAERYRPHMVDILGPQ